MEGEAITMSQQEWSRIRSVLEQALDLEPSERAAFVERACSGSPDLKREVEELLAAEGAAPWLEPATSEELGRALGRDAVPGRVGAWKLVRRIGEGGMGAVWLAERVEGGFAQRAAVKLIKRGMDTDDVLRRFARERAALAALEHPGIARLYDGGSTEDGRPYLVMEYVEGLTLGEHVERHKRSLAERLELVAKVCDAVDHAHERGLLHRDLKPQNVLVSADGTPKLLDFGIAKVLGAKDEVSRTATERRILTPHYASPEQLRGEELGRASDVFSLGVMLYELIEGRRPFESTRAPESEPQALTRSTRLLGGDLATVVRKALQIEPYRRYATAAAFADDLRRLVAGEPVLARPDTWTYRSSKFVRRNRALVIATGLVIVGLTTGLVVAWQQYAQAEVARRAAELDRQVADAARTTAETEREAAEQARESAEAARKLADARLESVVKVTASLTNNLTSRLATIDGILPQREAVLREMEQQLVAIRGQATGNEAIAIELGWVRRDLANVIGQPNGTSSGRYGEARELLTLAIADLEPWIDQPEAAEDLIACAAGLLTSRAEILVEGLKRDEARVDVERALAILRARRQRSKPSVALLTRECHALNALVSVERDSRNREAQERVTAEYLALVDDAVRLFPDSTLFRYWLATALINRASSELGLGQVETARLNLERGVEILRALHQSDPQHSVYRRALGSGIYYLAEAHGSLANDAEAARLGAEALEIHEETIRREPADSHARDMLVNYAYSAGTKSLAAGDLETASRQLQRTLEAVEERIARQPDRTALNITWASTSSELAVVLARRGEFDPAFEMCEKAFERAERLRGPGQDSDFEYGLGLVYMNSAKCRIEAAKYAERELDRRKADLALAADSAREARRLFEIADLLSAFGSDGKAILDEAEGVIAEADELAAKLADS
jgi:tRNA A-37 threonylcarbamoyl transferase component Bud32/tetratricopeptide (TPR) repeat protein